MKMKKNIKRYLTLKGTCSWSWTWKFNRSII